MKKHDITTAPVYVRHPFERVRTQYATQGDSKTHQSHADSCDINNIIRRFDNTGTLPPTTREAQYADVTALQEGDLTERINHSRVVLDAAGREMEAKQKAEQKSREEYQHELEDEIKRLKAEKAETAPKLTGEPGRRLPPEEQF